MSINEVLVKNMLVRCDRHQNLELAEFLPTTFLAKNYLKQTKLGLSIYPGLSIHLLSGVVPGVVVVVTA